jgi:predicted acetyltransferase
MIADGSSEFSLVTPSRALLHGVLAAMERGHAASDVAGARVEAAKLGDIAGNPDYHLALLGDAAGRGPPVQLPDGSFVPRLPGESFWMWDGEYAGNLSLRWQAGTPVLPPTCLGHIGYAVVPWKRRRGYATRAVSLVLPHARALGLPYVEITADPDNVGSRRAIENNGGIFVEEFVRLPSLGGTPCVRYRIDL